MIPRSIKNFSFPIVCAGINRPPSGGETRHHYQNTGKERNINRDTGGDQLLRFRVYTRRFSPGISSFLCPKNSHKLFPFRVVVCPTCNLEGRGKWGEGNIKKVFTLPLNSCLFFDPPLASAHAHVNTKILGPEPILNAKLMCSCLPQKW